MRAIRRSLQFGIPFSVKIRSWFSVAFTGSLLLAACLAQPAATERATGWIWVGGSDQINQPGDYGRRGKFARQDVPPGRSDAVTWTDRNGNLWLFGGVGDPSTDAFGIILNDLWEFNPTRKEWAWMGGSNGSETEGDVGGVYGSMGNPATENVPGSRAGAVGWTDKNGNLWLFGGRGDDATGASGRLNDMWEYVPGTHEWTWMGGRNSVDSKMDGRPGAYGTLGVPAPGNVPGSRSGAVGWTDQKGNLWLFGGTGFDANGVSGILNDLWEYEPASHDWIWMGGNKTVPRSGGGLPGVYGTLGEPAHGDMPGARSGAAGWTDRDGSLWLFGGGGIDANGASAPLNDLWKWNPETRTWTWMGGSTTSAGCSSPSQGPLIVCTGRPGVYGAMGVSAAGDIPGARSYAATWTDGTGNLWLLGGGGYDSADNDGILNDLWKFSSSSDTWTWIGGGKLAGNCEPAPELGRYCNGQPGMYGVLGKPGSENAPGGRREAAAWKDDSGNFWLFGGYGTGRVGKNAGELNDLWEYHVRASH
jgi:N-acetylneuraminic acid mutarotase